MSSKYVVCPTCEGEGYVGTLGAYTADEFAEAFESQESYAELHEASKQACPCCHGKRVATPDEIEAEKDRLEDLHTRRMECGYLS